MSDYKLPENFLWGAAIAANQPKALTTRAPRPEQHRHDAPRCPPHGVKLGGTPHPTAAGREYYPSHTGVDFYHHYKEDIA